MFCPVSRIAAGVLLALSWSFAVSAAELTPAQQLACARHALPDTEVAPFQPIRISGDSTRLAPLFVRPVSAHPVPVIPVRQTPEGMAFSLALHPDQGATGGVVTFNLGTRNAGGFVWCEQLHQVTLRSLSGARADQGVRSELQLLRQLLDSLLAPEGLTGAALAQADPQTLDGPALALWGPAYLAHGAHGIEPIYRQASPQGQQLADDLVAGWQTPREQQPVAFAPPAGARLEQPGGAQTVPLDAGSGAMGKPPDGVAGVMQDDGSAAAARARDCQSVDNSRLGHLLGQQLSGDTMLSGAAGIALTAGSEVSGLPVLSRVPGADAVGYLAWAVEFAADFAKNTRPSRLDDMWLDVTPVQMLEDYAGIGQVHEVGLQFSSEGWDMGPSLADLGISLAGGLAGDRMEKALDKRFEFINAQGVKESALAHPELITELTTWLGSKSLGAAVEQAGLATGSQVIAADCWQAAQSPATTAAPGQRQAQDLRLHYTRGIRQGEARDQFIATATGTGLIDARWALPVGEGLVGAFTDEVRQTRYAFAAQQPIDLPALNASISPQRQTVAAGERVSLLIEAGPALDTRVRLTDSLGQLDLELDAGSGHAVSYQVPADIAPGSRITLTAESLARTGLRDPASAFWRGPVSGRASLRLQQPRLFLQPDDFCLPAGTTRRYQALDDPLTGQPVAVSWQAEGARVTADGRLRAPDQEGQITLTAAARDNPALRASWTLTVGECSVRWHAHLSGSNAPLSHVQGWQAELSRLSVARSFSSGPDRPAPQGPFLRLDLKPAGGDQAGPSLDDMQSPEALLAYLRQAQDGQNGPPPRVKLTIPGFAPGRTGQLEGVVIQLGELDSLADLGKGNRAGLFLNTRFTTANLNLTINSSRRLAGEFSARLLPQGFPWGRGGATERETAIWHHPEQEVRLQGAFDIDLTGQRRLPDFYSGQ